MQALLVAFSLGIVLLFATYPLAAAVANPKIAPGWIQSSHLVAVALPASLGLIICASAAMYVLRLPLWISVAVAGAVSLGLWANLAREVTSTQDPPEAVRRLLSDLARSAALCAIFIAGFSVSLWAVNGGPDELFRVRLGIDAPLYVDAAEYLTDEYQSGAPSKTTFGIASLDVHLRRGLPFILALVKSSFGLTHAYFAVTPVVLVVMAIVAASSIALMARVVNSRGLVFAGSLACLVCYPIWHLTLEAQWPHLFAAAAVSSMAVSLGDQTSLRLACLLPLCTSAGLALAGIMLTYSEILPQLVAAAVLYLGLTLVFARPQFGALAWTLMGTAAIAIVAVGPTIPELARHLAALSIQGVGYPTPHFALPSEALGLGNVWGGPEAWMTGEVSVQPYAREDPLLDSLVALLAMAGVLWGALQLVKRRRELLLCSVAILTGMLATWIALTGMNSYIWAKAYSTYSVLLIAVLFAGLESLWTSRRRELQALAQVAVAGAAVYWAWTLVGGLLDFRASSRAFPAGALADRDLVPRDCSILLPPREARVDETDSIEEANARRYVNRTWDFYHVPIFRENAIVDVWTNVPIASGPGQNDSNSICHVGRDGP